MPIDSSSLNTGTTSDSSGSAGRRARCAASWRSSAEADVAETGKVESGTDGSLHHYRSGNDCDGSVEGHDSGINRKLGLAFSCFGPELAQRLGELLGLEGEVVHHALAVRHGAGAAVAMDDADHALDRVQLHGDVEIVPEGLAPVAEGVGDHADRPARDHELAVQVLEAASGHVGERARGEARVDAVEQHRLVLAAGRERWESRHHGTGKTGAEQAAPGKPRELGGQATAVAVVKMLAHLKVVFPCCASPPWALAIQVATAPSASVRAPTVSGLPAKAGDNARNSKLLAILPGLARRASSICSMPSSGPCTIRPG